eukprot:1342214-Rhodomonas_salina.1
MRRERERARARECRKSGEKELEEDDGRVLLVLEGRDVERLDEGVRSKVQDRFEVAFPMRCPPILQYDVRY